MIKPIRITGGLLILGIVSIALTACGSGGAKVVAPQDNAAPPAAAETVKTTETTGTTESVKVEEPVIASPGKEDTTTLASTEEPGTSPAEAGEPSTTDAATVQDSAELEVTRADAETTLLTSYSDYGFALKLDLGANVQAAGWTEPDPSLTQGIIAFTYGGVNANLVWGPRRPYVQAR